MELNSSVSLLNFSFGLFKGCYSDDGNTLVSPLSVMLALSMAAEGADGETLSAFLRVLSPNAPISDFSASLAEYVKSLPSDEKTAFSFADSIWVREGLKLKWLFARRNRSLFKAEISELPFDSEAVRKINAWVDKSTKGMIPEIISSANPEAMMYLINALAFEAE